MNNTAHFGLTATGRLVNLGVGANTKEVANLLADNAEAVAEASGNPIEIVALLNPGDLYSLRSEMTDALNNLDNDLLMSEPMNFGTEHPVAN